MNPKRTMKIQRIEMSEKRFTNSFQNKEDLLPICLTRLPVFSNSTQANTIHGTVKLSRSLSQKDLDILESIMAIGEKGQYKDDPERLAVAFCIPELLRFLGHKRADNHTWLFSKLRELENIEFEIKINSSNKFFKGTSIIEKYEYSEVLECDNHKKHFFGKGKKLIIVFTKEFTEIYNKDSIIYTSRDVIRAITEIKHNFIKMAVRYCLTHEKLNLTFSNLLAHLGLSNIAVSTKKKYKLLLKMYSEYVYKNFRILIENKRDSFCLFYNKDRKLIAIDFNGNRVRK